MNFEQSGNELIVKWDIAEEYYLYKKQFSIEADGALLGQPVYPKSEQIEDEFFGLSDVLNKILTLFTLLLKQIKTL